MTISRTDFGCRVKELLPRLLGVARRLASSDADAEDLVADTVERAWRRVETLNSPEAFRGWLFKILHNTFISDYRRQCARPHLQALEDEEEANEPPFSLFEQMHQPFLLWFSNPEQQFVHKLLREDLETALAALPEHHRIVVLLADLEEFNYAEISHALGIPLGTVRSRLARARSALQQRLWQQAQAWGLRAANMGSTATHDRGGNL